MSDEDQDFLDVNPDSTWLERTTIGGFRVWHIIAICLGIVMSIIIMVCCCVRFRIPRTKQEIEADYQRKQITKKFREKLQQIKNSDMDDMDLQKVCHYYSNMTTCYDSSIPQNTYNASWYPSDEIQQYYETKTPRPVVLLAHQTTKIIFPRYFVYPTSRKVQMAFNDPPEAIHKNYQNQKINNQDTSFPKNCHGYGCNL
ncbi:uncharacterized protein isoform X1 [Musca autumnalis]|uniref:uncharacterized protein isoform X1 n=1 Tax=Musca autumnalis TaxID=221902 RepID=UPI003CEE95DD